MFLFVAVFCRLWKAEGKGQQATAQRLREAYPGRFTTVDAFVGVVMPALEMVSAMGKTATPAQKVRLWVEAVLEASHLITTHLASPGSLVLARGSRQSNVGPAPLRKSYEKSKRSRCAGHSGFAGGQGQCVILRDRQIS